MKTIVVKIGTNVITREDGLLNTGVMEALVKQIAIAQKSSGARMIVVSSGAMGAGRGLVKPGKKLNPVARRQILAAVGQAELIQTYQALFKKTGLICAQVLATKEDFSDRRHYLNMRHCFESLLSENIIPVVNENDVVSVSELMFTDNDELAGLIASMMQADKLILLSIVNGILDAHGKTIERIRSVKTAEKYITGQKSSFGRGGMMTKCRMAAKLSRLGIVTHIAQGARKNVLTDILKGNPVGTVFAARPKAASRVKQWIATSEGRERGMVTINAGAAKILCDKKTIASLLPVGVIRVEGEFKKGDLLKIVNESGEAIGYGVAQYDTKKAQNWAGQHGKTELIHYDHLYIHGK